MLGDPANTDRKLLTELFAQYGKELTRKDFQAWVFSNPYKFYTQANPNFFKGTAVEHKLAARSVPQAAAAE